MGVVDSLQGLKRTTAVAGAPGPGAAAARMFGDYPVGKPVPGRGGYRRLRRRRSWARPTL